MFGAFRLLPACLLLLHQEYGTLLCAIIILLHYERLELVPSVCVSDLIVQLLLVRLSGNGPRF